MFEIFFAGVAVVSIGISSLLASRVARLNQRLRELEARLSATTVAPVPSIVVPSITAPLSLEGLSIALVIEQDHQHPLFANLLMEHLLREDVALVKILDAMPETGFDLTISGSISCNGYADVYQEANLVCTASLETICVIVEKPHHGDRPLNLARETISKIKEEWHKAAARGERMQALRELR